MSGNLPARDNDLLSPAPAAAGINVLAYAAVDPPRGSLRGFCDLHIPGFRIRLFACTAHTREGKRWVGLPSRPMIGRDGNTLRDDQNRVRYMPVIGFDDDKVRYRFSDAAAAALDLYSPNWSD